MTRTMVSIVVVAALLGLWTQAQAQPASDNQKIADLEERVKDLEAQVQKLQAQLAEKDKELAALKGTPAADPRASQQAAARKRMQQDTAKYTRAQITEAEQLYQVANKNWRSPDAQESLEKMIQKFPNLNRTGCAVLYLGQMAPEAETKEKYLKQAIEKYSDCFYGNGVQVGAFARFLLALHYQEAGQADKAKELFDQLRKTYPQAIDHRGRNLVSQIPE